MNDLQAENEALKLYLADAIRIANFTTRSHGFIIKQQLWTLKSDIDKAGLASDCELLDKMIKADS